MASKNISPIADELNSIIGDQNKNVQNMLSGLGKSIYFPKGIIAQSAEAKSLATRYNATIGIAKEKGKPMGLASVMQSFNGISEAQALTYAPACGIAELRIKWKELLAVKNPALSTKKYSLPIVTSGVTHGLSIVADLFVEEHDVVILPDKYWENYNLIFGVRRGANFAPYPFFNGSGGFNTEAFKEKVEEYAPCGKIIVVLNFPNNPTGYSPTGTEARHIAEILRQTAAAGCKVVAITDDAYFGLFYESEVYKESIFGLLADAHENLLAIMVGGPTKELYVWGLRCGFLSVSVPARNDQQALYAALEKKIAGIIRGTLSNCPLASQSIILRAIQDPDFEAQCKAKKEILRERALWVKEILGKGTGSKYWDVYPFNSGYFMCLKMKKIDAEAFRQHLLKNYGIGVIADGTTDIRVAFSSVELGQIEDLYLQLEKAASDLS
jgi:aspartate/methionine/tyrosine aminotransferase